MPSSFRSSRRRYREYVRARREAARKRETAARAADRDIAPPDLSDPHYQHRAKRQRSFWNLFAEFWRLLQGRHSRIFAALTTLSFAAVMVLIVPASTKFAFDYIIAPPADHPGLAGLPPWLPAFIRNPANRVDLLWLVGGFMVGISLIRILIGMWGRWQMTLLTKRTQMALRRRVFEHAVKLPLHRIHQIKSGGAASILREDAGGAAELLFHIIYNPWNAIVQLISTLVVLAWIDYRMLLGGIVLIPTVWLTHRTWIARIRPLYRDIKQTRTSIDAHATEAFGGIRIVRGFDRSKGEAGRFTRNTHFMGRQEILTWWWSRGIDIAWSLLIPLAATAVLVYGGRAVIRGELTIGDVMMFTALMMGLLGPLELLAGSATAMQTNLAAFDRILDLLQEPQEFADTQAAPPKIGITRETPGRITLRHVSFAYPRAEKAAKVSRFQGVKGAASEPPSAPALADASTSLQHVLTDISLDIAPGETIALVGPSGSGKTTLCNLIARFYDPTSGIIELDGIDLRRIDVNSYRRLLGIVEQDVFLFDGAVAENIGYGNRHASRQQIIEAARAANAHGFISELEDGYDTLIGERGVRLSGGQKQRLAIARALLADPRILILDEATSSLDTESERLIQRSLSRLMQNRTSFVIAHRLSTIRHADRIVVLEAGRIIEVGTHEELLNSPRGRYAEFLRMQLEPAPNPTDPPQPSESNAAAEAPLRSPGSPDEQDDPPRPSFTEMSNPA
jgi:ATP-binding cassette, subfamily B, bacterial